MVTTVQLALPQEYAGQISRQFPRQQILVNRRTGDIVKGHAALDFTGDGRSKEHLHPQVSSP